MSRGHINYRQSYVINLYSSSGHTLQSGPVNFFIEQIIDMALIAAPSPNASGIWRSLQMDAKCSTKAVCTILACLASNLNDYPLIWLWYLLSFFQIHLSLVSS